MDSDHSYLIILARGGKIKISVGHRVEKLQVSVIPKVYLPHFTPHNLFVLGIFCLGITHTLLVVCKGL